ncbi:MAG: stage III sporulation protein AB [Firmicutes bacterium]|nr:stage III sporulation protein AB [Bacillota bacterium]
MLKFTGAILVIVVCGLLGNDIARGYAQRPRLLRSLQTALQFLQTEINYGVTPLLAALKKVAALTDPQLAAFFLLVRDQLLLSQSLSFREAWERGLKDLGRYSVLGPRELELLLPLGGILGCSDREDQVKHLLLTCQQLKEAEMRERERSGPNERLWRYLGFLLGVMLILTFY